MAVEISTVRNNNVWHHFWNPSFWYHPWNPTYILKCYFWDFCHPTFVLTFNIILKIQLLTASLKSDFNTISNMPLLTASLRPPSWQHHTWIQRLHQLAILSMLVPCKNWLLNILSVNCGGKVGAGIGAGPRLTPYWSGNLLCLDPTTHV